jgi:hypothetical protein
MRANCFESHASLSTMRKVAWKVCCVPGESQRKLQVLIVPLVGPALQSLVRKRRTSKQPLPDALFCTAIFSAEEMILEGM